MSLVDHKLISINESSKLTKYKVKVHHGVKVRMRDGVVISCNLWIPIGGGYHPAILEMIPYRKDDWHYNADHSLMQWMAENGYIGCRADTRGTGSSGGIATGEYSEDELQDGIELINWLSEHRRCTGNVGIYGISYGGFLAIQIAARRPAKLKVIIPLYATDDRYTTDVHYLGGRPTSSEKYGYALSQIAMNALPPDKRYVKNWKSVWTDRLERSRPWLFDWMKHPVKDDFWKHGTLYPHYDRITAAMLLIAGWNDNYVDATIRMMHHCQNQRSAIIGNWGHSFPDEANPGPNIDYLSEILRFLDRHLKNESPQRESNIIHFHRTHSKPNASPDNLNGSWYSELEYPSTIAKSLYLGAKTLSAEHGDTRIDHYHNEPTVGAVSSLLWGPGNELNAMPRDPQLDEAASIIYTSEALVEDLSLFGFPQLEVWVKSDRPESMLVAKIYDISDAGTDSLVTIGIISLPYHGDHQPTVSSGLYKITLPFKAISYQFTAGHKIRLSICGSHWPTVWPCLADFTNTIYTGPKHPSRLIMPTYKPTTAIEAKPVKARLRSVGKYEETSTKWTVDRNMEGIVQVSATSGDTSKIDNETIILTSTETIKMTCKTDDQTTARLHSQSTYELTNDGDKVEIDCRCNMGNDSDGMATDVNLVVKLNSQDLFTRKWRQVVPSK